MKQKWKDTIVNIKAKSEEITLMMVYKIYLIKDKWIGYIIRKNQKPQ